MFDVLWKAGSKNTSVYATKLTSLPQAQAVLDDLLVACQHQLMAQSLLSYQMKLQVSNLVSGMTKDKATHRLVFFAYGT